jgi:hypothetical protein
MGLSDRIDVYNLYKIIIGDVCLRVKAILARATKVLDPIADKYLMGPTLQNFDRL